VLSGDYVALESLDAPAIALNDSQVYDYRVTGLKFIDVVERLSLDQ
jgi:hypothetical protein